MNLVLIRSVFIAALIAPQAARGAHGQATRCPYDACALRLHRGSLVQGLEATRVARFGAWFSAPRIDVFETASDSARGHYQAFRALYHQGAKLRTAGLALTLASAVAVFSDTHANHYYVPIGLAVLGLATNTAARSKDAHAWDHLHKAIWFYNRDLPRSP
jgi:hypothetical protein